MPKYGLMRNLLNQFNEIIYCYEKNVVYLHRVAYNRAYTTSKGI